MDRWKERNEGINEKQKKNISAIKQRNDGALRTLELDHVWELFGAEMCNLEFLDVKLQ
jgi:hypothetical protein